MDIQDFSKIKIWIVIIFIVFISAGVVICEHGHILNGAEDKAISVETDNTDDNKWLSHELTEFNIKFQYPSHWGTLVKEEKPFIITDKGEEFFAFSFSDHPTIFLTAVSPDYKFEGGFGVEGGNFRFENKFPEFIHSELKINESIMKELAIILFLPIDKYIRQEYLYPLHTITNNKYLTLSVIHKLYWIDEDNLALNLNLSPFDKKVLSEMKKCDFEMVSELGQCDEYNEKYFEFGEKVDKQLNEIIQGLEDDSVSVPKKIKQDYDDFIKFVNSIEPIEKEEKAPEWNTYRNEEYNYEIKYPFDWKYLDDTQRDCFSKRPCVSAINFRILNGEYPCGIDISVFNNPDNLLLKNWLYDFKKEVNLNWEESLKEVVIGDNKGLRLTFLPSRPGSVTWQDAIYFAEEKFIYEIGLPSNIGAGDFSPSLPDGVINQILSTFEFLE